MSDRPRHLDCDLPTGDGRDCGTCAPCLEWKIFNMETTLAEAREQREDALYALQGAATEAHEAQKQLAEARRLDPSDLVKKGWDVEYEGVSGESEFHSWSAFEPNKPHYIKHTGQNAAEALAAVRAEVEKGEG